MSRLTSNVVVAAVLGQLLGLLGWIDPLFVPLVLIGPLVTGAVAAGQQVRYAWVGALWASAGLNMVWTDWLVNSEDQVFHLALSIIMPLLAAAGWGTVRLATHRNNRAETRG